MFKFLLASLLSINPAPVAVDYNIYDHPPKANLHMSAIRLIKCGVSFDASLGTAVYIDPRGILITAAHVVDNGACVDVATGQSYKTYYVDKNKDYAFLSGDTKHDRRFIPQNCGGMVKGHRYLAIGYGNGYDLRVDIVTYTGNHSSNFEFDKGVVTHYADPLAELNGVLVPGMSGGAMFDLDTGTLVGINNITTAWTQAFSREIKDTVLCSR